MAVKIPRPLSLSANISFFFSQKFFVATDLFSEINDQPMEPNGFCFPSFYFLSRSKSRIMSAERVEKRATQGAIDGFHCHAIKK